VEKYGEMELRIEGKKEKLLAHQKEMFVWVVTV